MVQMDQLPGFCLFIRFGLVIIQAMTSPSIKSPCILLIDDHAILLDGLRMLLEAQITQMQVLTVNSLGESLQLDAMPDVIVLDIKLSGISGLEGLASLQRKWPKARVMMLSSQDDASTQQLALARGAAAFVSKAETGKRIVEVINNLLLGNITTLTPQPTTPTAQQYLTPRQCEVLDFLNQGLTNKVIARKLNLSDNTVRRHVQDIFTFFCVASRTEAVFEARRQGIVH